VRHQSCLLLSLRLLASHCCCCTASTCRGTEQWRLATHLTEFVGEAITAAVGWAGKLVNGGEGDWCSDTADIITEMWSESLLAKDSKMPQGYSIMDAQCLVDFAGVYNTTCDFGKLLDDFEDRGDVYLGPADEK
jgi:hypothetical protein